jgi:hypothetical protein
MRIISVKPTRNINNVPLLKVVVETVNPEFSIVDMEFHKRQRIFSKTEGCDWVEGIHGSYKPATRYESSFLNEYCSHYGYAIPRS